MVTALILSGGTGTRLGGSIPKQYLAVRGRPILLWCLDRIEEQPEIDAFVVVAAGAWQEQIRAWIRDEGYQKFAGFAEAGSSRQHSIFRGLQQMEQNGASERDIVIVHDAVRPLVSREILRECVTALAEADGAMPVITVKDTVYKSADGRRIDSLLNRDELYAGQAPESFRFGPYYALHQGMTEEELGAVRGSSELAYRGGLLVRMIRGDEGNYKITTMDDLEKYRSQMQDSADGGKAKERK